VIDAAQAQVVPPQVGRAHLWSILRALAGAQPAAMPLAETLTHARTIVSVRDSAVVLTPSIDAAWTSALHALAAGARDGLEVVLFDPASFGGAGNGAALAALLRGWGVPTHLLRRQDIQPVMASYDRLRRWEFKTLGTGRVVVQQTPRSLASGAP